MAYLGRLQQRFANQLRSFHALEDAKIALASNGSAITRRLYASDGDGEQPPAPATTEADDQPAASSPATPPKAPGGEPTIDDLIAAGYTKRQAAYLAPDPEKHKHYLPRLSRKEKGSFTDERTANEFAKEMQLYPTLPDVPIYNLDEVVPEIYQSQIPLFDKLVALKKEFPNETPIELAERLGMTFPEEEQPPYPGAKRILWWQGRYTLVVGSDQPHPADKKARCRVHLGELGEEAGITMKGLEWIAKICGPRYDANTGILLLTSDKYADREDNRRDVLKMLRALVEEGKKKDAEAGVSPVVVKEATAV